MQSAQVRRRAVSPRVRLAFGTFLLTLVLTPASGLAQTTTAPAAQSEVYAVTDLNMRKGPGSNDAIISTVPLGAAVRPVSDVVSNDYTRVTYNGVTGWVVALGLVDSPDEVDDAVSPTDEGNTPLSAYNTDVRVTLTPLMLRTGPGIDAEPLTGMPEGTVVTLTREGAENGYVTVDYDGEQGWAYADLLARPDEVS